jgi:hypothetical protein
MTRIVPKFTLPSHESKKFSLFKPLAALVVIAAVAAAGFFGWKYWQTQKQLSDLKNKDEIAKQEVAELTKTVGALIKLPEETPTVATVTDKSKLAKNDFFKQAENGDKVLIYAQARRAYLYRPTAKQLIDVTPLSIQSDASGSAQTQTNASPLSAEVTLLNGTTTTGLTNQYETKLKQIFPAVKVARKQNAAQTTYQKTFIVDVTGDNSSIAREMAQNLGIEVQPLPEGEATPSTALAIILGADAQ